MEKVVMHTWDYGSNLTVGLAIWQFANMREEDAGGGAAFNSALVPDRNKPNSRNNKGTLNVHHRPKPSYYSIRQVWCPGERLEW
jgi:hypothetical protein